MESGQQAVLHIGGEGRGGAGVGGGGCRQCGAQVNQFVSTWPELLSAGIDPWV